MINALRRFYNSFGDRGVMMVIFTVSVIVHSLLTMHMELPAVNPDEIGVASVAAFYSGRDWSALMGQVYYYYGYVQAIFYAPLFLFFSNSYALYKACLIMNGVLMSFIPVIAYHVSTKLGVSKVWQKITVAFCCGAYITYIAHSKFMWNEAICSLLPWVLMWVMFMSMDCQKDALRVLWSAAAGVLCAVCYGAHSRLLAVVIAFVMTVLIARIFMNRRIFTLPVFFPALALGFVGEHFCKKTIQQLVWNGKASGNTMEAEANRVLGLFDEGGFGRFVSTLFGHIYTFMTSTAGIGALACVVFFMLIFVRIREWSKNRAGEMVDGVKVYEPTSKHTYSGHITILGIYAFLAVGGSMLLSVLFKFNSGQISAIKDLTMFGRYTDNVAPLAVMLVLVFMFRYRLSVANIGWAAIVYAYTCYGFFTVSWQMLEKARGYRESPMLGLMPWRIGEDYAKPFTVESFIIMTSVVFTVLAAVLYFAVFPSRLDLSGSWLVTAYGGEMDAATLRSQLGVSSASYILETGLVAITLAPAINMFFALGEEAGWRGYMMPRLKERFGLLNGRLLGGVVWGVWHWPLMLLVGYEYGTNYLGAPVLGLVVWCVVCFALNTLLDLLYEKTGCIWVPAIAHGAFNAIAALPQVLITPADAYYNVLGPMPIGLISVLPMLAVAVGLTLHQMKQEQ